MPEVRINVISLDDAMYFSLKALCKIYPLLSQCFGVNLIDFKKLKFLLSFEKKNDAAFMKRYGDLTPINFLVNPEAKFLKSKQTNKQNLFQRTHSLYFS